MLSEAEGAYVQTHFGVRPRKGPSNFHYALEAADALTRSNNVGNRILDIMPEDVQRKIKDQILNNAKIWGLVVAENCVPQPPTDPSDELLEQFGKISQDLGATRKFLRGKYTELLKHKP